MEKVRVDKRSIEKEVKEISVLGIGRKSECSCFENNQIFPLKANTNLKLWIIKVIKLSPVQ